MQWSWTTLVLLFAFWSASACPEGCSCRHQQGLYSANCSTLPYNGGKVEALTLIPSWDSPLELSDGQFSSAKHLKYLTLRNCSIYFIHKKAFYGVKNMIELDLSFNYIEDLDPTVFQHLSSLKTLLLRGNPIHFVSELPFLFSNSIQHLDIGQCKITNIHRGIFYGLKRLQYLSLDGNLLKTLGYNSLPKGLKYLNLSKNLIANVPTEVISALTNLRRLGLAGNPINCSCSLMNLQDWLSGRGVIFEGDVICASPSKYHGINWSKVDENKLCLAEARREELTYSKFYNPLFKNRLHRGNYFESENSYSDENIQSDQPNLIPDPEAEILFQNDKTKSMGYMMRDEEAKELNEKGPTELNVEHVTNKQDDKSTTDDKSSPEDTETNTEDSKTTAKETNTTMIGEIAKKSEEVLSVSSDDTNKLQNLYDSDTSVKNNSENMVQQNNVTHENELSEATEDKAQNVLPFSSEPSNDLEENSTSSKEAGDLFDSALTTSQPTNITSVEFKTLNEEEQNTEVDELKKEGFFHAVNDKYKLEENGTEEDSTVFPEIENTTDDDEATTELPLPEELEEQSNVNNQSSTSTPDTNNNTIIESEPEEEVLETISPPVVIPDLEASGETKQNTSGLNANLTYPISNMTKIVKTDGVNESDTFENRPERIEEQKEKVKEVVGAEVVMFCVAVIIICLILYSVYKCRKSSKRQSLRNSKDIESTRGTELQDMASLLPKPQEDNKKNNVNYNEKSPSSETVKLLPEQPETPNHSAIPDNKNKVQDKNSLNNNTPLSPVSATPLIKPDNISTNPVYPTIQRTKVKVGIIPDSIPRTPIFVQKTYNGTKHV